jgi:hypothetical protein
VLEEKLGYPFRGDHFQTRSNDYPLRKAMVYHDHDRIETSRRREIGNQIHRQASEQHGHSGRDRHEGRSHRVCIRFHLLTKGATLNIFMDIVTKAWPPVIPLDKFFHLKTARVTRHRMIMKSVEKIVVKE